jgi:hypothetical protein
MEQAINFMFFWGVVIPIVIVTNGTGIALVIYLIKGAWKS